MEQKIGRLTQMMQDGINIVFFGGAGTSTEIGHVFKEVMKLL